MICVDTSALMAIALGEPEGERCSAALAAESEVLISAATITEALIVAGGRGVDGAMRKLIEDPGLTVVDVTRAAALGAADAQRRWGKGRHPARLNFGDCFAYEVAERHRCPLLYVGDDFSKTDIVSVL